ncbi:AMP-binding protein [Nocardia macrotermitis]|uniref:AMP-dependent synthetase/ligase domain-containing protein n=1 Tax=Nocardia macrotermitis TaxID=2585198 RepID=A0A7K0D3A2_9NOCA|nr:AMP-binding protein [Nocardia macrotermitis]MQY20210.1 hypothetical protein [Nocardia macrotermitis]
MTALEAPSDRPSPDPGSHTIDIAPLLRRLAGLPSVADRYLPFLATGRSVTLSELPLLSKSDLELVFPELLQQIRQNDTSAYLYASGGTTSAPKLSLIPADMFVPDILTQWRPLSSNDVIANIYSPGRLWSSHNFFNAVAAESGAICLAFGSLDDKEVPQWLEFFEQRGVTALDGTASQIAQLLEACARSGHRPPQFINKLLWTGEAFDEHTDRLVRELLPEADRYGVYGSTETWVVGHSGPSCSTNVFHTLPYQRVELVGGEIVITNIHPQAINPLLRYRIGDRGEHVDCGCGATTPGLRVLGRADTQIKFRSVLLTAEELVATAEADPAVRRAQVILLDHGAAEERLIVSVIAATNAPEDLTDTLRAQILSEVYRLASATASDPASFTIEIVSRLELNPRTHKTPILVSRPSK